MELTNILSATTQRYLGKNNAIMANEATNLVSTKRISKAADDAAGSAIATKLNVKAASLSKAIDNADQAIAMLQTAESGMSTIADALTRLKEIATQAASDNNSTDRTKLQTERARLELSITNIANSTKYGATALLDGGGATVGALGADLSVANGINGITAGGGSATAGAYTVDIAAVAGGKSALTVTDGSGNAQTINVTVPTAGSLDVSFATLGITVNVNSQLGSTAVDHTVDDAGFTVTVGADRSFTFQLGDVSNTYNHVDITIGGMGLVSLGLNGIGDWTDDEAGRTAAQTYLNTLNEDGKGIDYINTKKADVGAVQNQITNQKKKLTDELENTITAKKTIEDTKYEESFSNFIQAQIAVKVDITVLAQVNQLPQEILNMMK
ncbi:MAG: Flagellin C [Syntrophorhabdaceae bacterium PtaU1.Bin034]|nr:MAG: Flagellin C [Syntrophorhabdaceae bacterium PtaU1.Bin034]